MLKKTSASLALAIGIVFAASSSAFAHVTVKPGEVEAAARQVFSVGVPNESEAAEVVGVRLVIPEGLESVRPNAKAGWTVEVKKTGEGEDAKVSELIWTGGSVPVDQRDEFLFQGKAPAKTGELKWKAYETYSDGTTVAWEEEPSEKEGSKPYSVTKIVEPAKPAANVSSEAPAGDGASNGKVNLAIALGALGAILSGVALATKRK